MRLTAIDHRLPRPDAVTANPRSDQAPIAWRLVSDGDVAYEREIIFAGVAAAELDAAGIGSEVVTPYHALLVTTGGRVILVDAGLGELAGAMGGTAGRLVDSLRDVGLRPAEIDDVVITHAHADHVGGLTTGGRPTFDRARHHVTRHELDFWLGEQPSERLFAPLAEMLVASARSAFTALQKAGLLRSCDPDAVIAPGVRLVPAPGHTPGHVAVELDNGGDTMLYLSDTVLHEQQFAHPEWTSAVDTDPAQTVVTRRAILDHAAERGTLVAGFHLPKLARVSRAGHGYGLESARALT